MAPRLAQNQQAYRADGNDGNTSSGENAHGDVSRRNANSDLVSIRDGKRTWQAAVPAAEAQRMP